MREVKTTRVLASGRYLRLIRDANDWEHVERIRCTGIVVIVALTPEGKLLLVEQHRPPVGKRVIELPAGLTGDLPGAADEPLEEAANRELVEETGYRAGRLRRLTAGPPSAGLSNEVVDFLRASELERVGPGGGDATEAIVVHEVPLAEADGWLRRRAAQGTLVDPKVYAGLYFASREDD